ncbi:F-box/WD repeat-containing protein pof11 [Grifola frondosa]|uniref:F-box/WD repeat-containing protein pof11 n=1 Tax=Grifola frondosa TaxID=5627 RepID=A0A1C7LZB1_GRIFR|nr:F-box/WD repeat-containing protein pof11 [Grifola frondosa]
MITLADEGFTDDEVASMRTAASVHGIGVRSVREREEFVYGLLTSLPRSSLAAIQRRIAPLLQLDVVGLLPDEVALHVFSYLPYQALLTCALVSRRWRTLADDQSLWKKLCMERNWQWRVPPNRPHGYNALDFSLSTDSDDEGMGDEEEAEDPHFEDSGHASLSVAIDSTQNTMALHSPPRYPRVRHSAPPTLASPMQFIPPKADFKLLHQTHIRLHNRMTSGSYSFSSLQTRGAPNGHTNTIYCLQLYTYPETGVQVLFTGSKDHTIREWDLATGSVVRVIDGVHSSSILSICVHNGFLASGGSDRKVAIWDLTKNAVVRVICDHHDSVLCVRFDDRRLVSCSKDKTVRTYLFPDLTPQFILGDHRAAVNAVSISPTHIVSASGDRSMRLWDAETGALLRTFENHHGRGIASIDFKPPFVLSGSSDKHLRLLDIYTAEGWSTSHESDKVTAGVALARGAVCETCGSRIFSTGEPSRLPGRQRAHEDLVRSVALSADFVVSGSYDFTVKVWDRKTGTLVADLAGGHTGRIFCVGFDCTKIVSCGEDQRICIWDFSHGINTSFINL